MFLACENAENLRVLHERIVGELPKRDQSVVEAANEVLEVVEEMQGMLEVCGNSLTHSRYGMR